jgi:hypothetical protein
VIPLPCRHKGGAPQLGAKGPGELGPFGEYGDGDQDDEEQLLDDDQAEQHDH